MESLNRAIVRRWCCAAVFSAYGILGARKAVAIPIDRFDMPVEVECAEGAVCAGIVRSESTIGRYTGLSLSRRGEGEISAKVSRKGAGRLTLEVSGVSSAMMVLSWDADQHPEVLSGSGLNCVDLTREGAHAFIVSGVSVESECVAAEGLPSACPSFGVETRIYDAHDPTGQRFSGSVITRTLTDETDVVIPFSNFVREGPRGKADFSCVGAITMTFRFDGFESVEMEIGPIYTNGSEGLTPLPTATPMSTPTATFTPEMVVTITAAPTAPPYATAMVDLSPTSVSSKQEAPIGEVPSVVSLRGAAEGSVVETPHPSVVVPKIPSQQEEEIFYGEVVAGGK